MFWVSVLILFGVLSDGEILEPTSTCYNRFEYEYHVLQELANHAKQLKDLEERIDALPGGSLPHCQTCHDGWVSYNGSCYLFGYGHAVNFAGAVEFCAQFGAVLVHVNNEQEDNFLREKLTCFKANYWWLGLNDQVTEGDWRWMDTGEPAKYTGFYPGEPQSGGGKLNEDCAGFYHPYSFKWVDIGCSSTWFPICEKW